MCPKHAEQAIRSAIKIHLLHLVGILFPHNRSIVLITFVGNLLDEIVMQSVIIIILLDNLQTGNWRVVFLNEKWLIWIKRQAAGKY
jgi:hypothetical protein